MAARSKAARLLGFWVRIPPGTCMFVCCECCVLSGRGLCDGLTLVQGSRARAERDGTRAETTFCLPPKRTSPFKSAGESVQLTAGSRGVRISVSNAGYTTFRGRVKSTGYPLHSPISPSLSLPCVTVCHHIPNAV